MSHHALIWTILGLTLFAVVYWYATVVHTLVLTYLTYWQLLVWASGVGA